MVHAFTHLFNFIIYNKQISSLNLINFPLWIFKKVNINDKFIAASLLIITIVCLNHFE
jgi:hypothetical protein